MKKIRTEDAVGHVLPHDMTRIIKGVSKGVAFKKGHIIQEEDVQALLDMGKEHVYVLETTDQSIHEDEGAVILSEIALNEGMTTSDIKEGKIEVIADRDGFFQVDVEKLHKINSMGDMMIATRMENLPVKKGDKLAGMRIIPLFIEKERMELAKEIGGEEPILKLTPFRKLKGGIVTTGSEVYHGRIKDTFTPVIEEKFKQYGVEYIHHEICDDSTEMIQEAILRTKEKGADIILCTGGMSVDPDDLTPAAIKSSGTDIVTYGTPVLPGAMFMLGYFEDGTAIMGLPGCVMYSKITVFDIIYPYIVAGVPVTKDMIASLGYGGLCLNCEICHYPNCQFGKGV